MKVWNIQFYVTSRYVVKLDLQFAILLYIFKLCVASQQSWTQHNAKQTLETQLHKAEDKQVDAHSGPGII